MTKINKHTIILLLITLFALPLHAATVEKIVASVNGDAITLSDLEAGTKVYGPEIRKTEKISGTTLKARVLDKLIDEKLLETQIEKSDITVPPHEIDAQIERALRGRHMTEKAFNEALLKEGLTITQYRQSLHDEILRNKFLSSHVSRKISISERELKDYFDKHMDDFKSPTSARLAQLTIPFSSASSMKDVEKMQQFAVKLTNEAKKSSNYEALAKKYNGKPFVVQGGNLGVVSLQDLQPAIAQAVAELGADRVAGPVVTNSGVHIIKVIERAKTSEKDFSAVREQVSNTVFNIKFEEGLNGYLRQLRKKAHIEIKSLGN